MDNQVPLQSFTITTDLSDALIGYLKTKPYEEVMPLIQGLQGAYQSTVNSLNAELPTIPKVGEDEKKEKK